MEWVAMERRYGRGFGALPGNGTVIANGIRDLTSGYVDKT
jgi:hypothetical protein